MTFRILSFCGGGIRGYLSALMLKNLQNEVRKKANDDSINILDHFDMVTGTSTGAIISGLIALGLNPDQLITFYRPLLQELWAANKLRPESHNPRKPEFPSSAEALKRAAKHFDFIDKKLEDVTKHKILTTSFFVQNSQQYQPGFKPVDKAPRNDSWGMVLFNNFQNSDTKDVHIFDAMLASGAMPGMTSTVPVKRKNPVSGKEETLQCVDGAFVNHNPVIPAVAMAVENGEKLEDISVIDFGTGFMQNYLTGDFEKWGSEQWMSLPAGNESVLPKLLVNSKNEQTVPILNMMLNGTSTNEMPTINSLLLKDKYSYLNADFGTRQIPEDATDNADLDFMQNLAEKQVDYSCAATQIKDTWLREN